MADGSLDTDAQFWVQLATGSSSVEDTKVNLSKSPETWSGEERSGEPQLPAPDLVFPNPFPSKNVPLQRTVLLDG